MYVFNLKNCVVFLDVISKRNTLNVKLFVHSLNTRKIFQLTSFIEQSFNIAQSDTCPIPAVKHHNGSERVFIFQACKESNLMVSLLLFKWNNGCLEFIHTIDLSHLHLDFLKTSLYYTYDSLALVISANKVIVVDSYFQTKSVFSSSVDIQCLYCQVNRWKTVLIIKSTILNWITLAHELSGKMNIKVTECDILPSPFVRVAAYITFNPVVCMSSPACDLNNRLRNNNCFVATFNQRLLRVKNGVVETSIRLNYVVLELAFLDSATVSEVIVVKTENSLCVFKKDFECILKCNTPIEFVLGDFLCSGTTQVAGFTRELQLGRDVNETDFILSDLCNDSYGSLPMESHKDVPDFEASENLTVVLDALQRQSQDGCFELDTLRSKLAAKDLFLKKTSEHIAAANEDFLNTDDHLMNVLSDPITPAHNFDTSDPKNELPCSQVWKMVVHRSVVCGVTVHNNTNRCLHGLRLILIQDNYEGMQATSFQHFAFSCLHKNSMPEGKQSKLQKEINYLFSTKPPVTFEKQSANLGPNDTIHLTTCSAVDVSTPTRNYTVLLEWGESSSREVNLRERGHLLTQEVGRIAVTLDDTITSASCQAKINSVSAKQSLHLHLALESTQISMPLIVSPVQSQLDERLFKETLCKLGFHLHPQLGYYINEEMGLFYQARVKVACSAHETRIWLHCSDDDTVMMLIHSLYKHLPDDVMILPYEQKPSAKDFKHASQTLHQATRIRMKKLQEGVENVKGDLAERSKPTEAPANVEETAMFAVDLEEISVDIETATNPDQGIENCAKPGLKSNQTAEVRMHELKMEKAFLILHQK